MIKNVMKEFRISDIEKNLIERRYGEVDLDVLLEKTDEFATLTKGDILVATISDDLRDGEFTPVPVGYNSPEEVKEALELLKRKLMYYIDTKGGHYIEGFDIEQNVENAEKITQKALGLGIGGELFRIDMMIQYFHSINDERLTRQYKNLAVYFGTAMGQIMLQQKLFDMNCDWEVVDGFIFPVIYCPDSEWLCDPIGFIEGRLNHTEKDGFERNCGDYFYEVIDGIREKHGKKDIAYFEARDIALKINKDYDAAIEYDEGYRFYENSNSIIGVVILKETGEVMNWSDFIINVKKGKMSRTLDFETGESLHEKILRGLNSDKTGNS